MNYDDIIDEDFTINEIEASIRRLQPNKAGVPPSLLTGIYMSDLQGKRERPTILQ